MSSKYADLGALATCPDCGDTVRRHHDGNGRTVDLDVREAPTHLVPAGLRWRVTGHGTVVDLGWANPTDTVRVPHRAICTARPPRLGLGGIDDMRHPLRRLAPAVSARARWGHPSMQQSGTG